MAGRFPFPQGGDGRGRPPQQMTSAQMRAALGLPVEDLSAFYAQHQQQQQQQQQRQQDAQRDLQIRQLFFQEQLGQRLQEHQLLVLGERLSDYPDLQRHYLMMNEGLHQRMEEQALLRQHVEQQAQVQAQAHYQEALQQEQLRQQLLRLNGATVATEPPLSESSSLSAPIPSNIATVVTATNNPSTRPTIGSPPSLVTNNVNSNLKVTKPSKNKAVRKRSRSKTTDDSTTSSNNVSVTDITANTSGNSIKTKQQIKGQTDINILETPSPALKKRRGRKPKPPPLPPAPPALILPKESPIPASPAAAAAKVDTKNNNSSKNQTSPKLAPASATGSTFASPTTSTAAVSQLLLTTVDDDDNEPDTVSATEENPEVESLAPAVNPLDQFASAAVAAAPQFIRKGTLEELLDAAEKNNQVDDAAAIITMLKNMDCNLLSDEDDENTIVPYDSSNEQQLGLTLPSNAAEFIMISNFHSFLPQLPQEPVLIETDNIDMLSDENPMKALKVIAEAADRKKEYQSIGKEKGDGKKPKRVMGLPEYPYNVDTWWPSATNIAKERHNSGETTDEDNFEESEIVEGSRFRANDKKIRDRLANKLEPGVLEKIPHCRIHRLMMRKKKILTTPELVYCWQVTELYPNDMMVVCSCCGVWRHAACGGHHKEYSTRACTKEPFTAVCEQCHEESKYLEEYPIGARRLERQRMEQLRRGLVTTAVMRHASISKHSGTYKWPLGSVSGSHINGHTRSVHARHEKVMKQWADMNSKLGRGFGYRPKERVRLRTKELERLLVSIEDAENYTDRHNMYLFLSRDTVKDVPVGYENQFCNMFDPADDECPVADTGEMIATNDTKDTDSKLALVPCMRENCQKRRRFDSVYCSDACGVSAMEKELLNTLREVADIHPSSLRH